jgi:hypothetical protein
MEAQAYGRNNSGDQVASRIRLEWAIRQVRLGLMDMQEAALAARVPVTSFAAAVELEVTSPLPRRPAPAPAQRGWEAARPSWTAPPRPSVTAEART